MKTLSTMRAYLSFLYCLLAVNLLAATDATFNLNDFGAYPTTNRTLTLQQQSPFPGAVRFYTSDSNGLVTVSNLSATLYVGEIKAPPQRIQFKLNVTSTNLGTVDARTLVAADSISTFPAGQVAWSAWASDARYLPADFSTNIFPAIIFSNNPVAGTNSAFLGVDSASNFVTVVNGVNLLRRTVDGRTYLNGAGGQNIISHDGTFTYVKDGNGNEVLRGDDTTTYINRQLVAGTNVYLYPDYDLSYMPDIVEIFRFFSDTNGAVDGNPLRLVYNATNQWFQFDDGFDSIAMPLNGVFFGSFSGLGASLTNLDASNISAGTLAPARLPYAPQPASATLSNATSLATTNANAVVYTNNARFLATLTNLNGAFTNANTFTSSVVATIGTNIFTPAAITQLAGSGGGGTFNPTNTQFYSPNGTTLTNGGLKIAPTNIVTSWSTNGTAVKWWGYTAPISNAALGHFGEFRASSTAQANSFGDGLGDLTYSFGLNYGGDVTGNSSYGVAPTNMPNWTWTRESSYQNGAGQTALEAWESWGSPYTANGTNCQWRWFGADLFWDTTNKTYISSDANFSVGSFSISGPFNKYNGSTYGFVVSSPSAGSGGMNVTSAGNYLLTTNDVSQATSLTVNGGYGSIIKMQNPTNSQTWLSFSPSATKVQVSGSGNNSNFNHLVTENFIDGTINFPMTLSNATISGNFINGAGYNQAIFNSGIQVGSQGSNNFYGNTFVMSGQRLVVGPGAWLTFGDNGTNRYAGVNADNGNVCMTNFGSGGLAYKVGNNASGTNGTLMLTVNGPGTSSRVEGCPANSVAITNAILVAYNGVASYATNTTLTVAATGITNTLSINYTVAGFTGTTVTQTNASGYGFSRGTITMPTDITLQPGAKLIGTGCAAAGAYAW